MSHRGGMLALVAVLALAVPVHAADEATTVDASKGGVTFKSGNNSLTLGAYVQVRFTGDDKDQYDADTAGSGVGRADGFSDSFKVQKMRVNLQGGMFVPWLKYKFEYEFSDTTGDNANKIKDAYLDFTGAPLATVRVGQFKAPFSLEELTPDTKQEFVDRAITNAKFSVGRDQGVMLSGLTKDRKLGYGVGIFNGSGESRAQEDQANLYVGRIWFDPLGEYKLSEGPVDAPEKPVFHVGAGVRTGEVAKGTATAGVFESPDNETAWNLELAFARGRWFATGEWFRMTNERKNPTEAPDIVSDGYHVQGGVMVIPHSLELGLRYATIDPDKDVDDTSVTEIRGVVTWYWKGHNLKLQTDLGTMRWDAAFSSLPTLASRNMPALGTVTGTRPQRLGGAQAYTDKQIRAQVQLAF